MLDNFKKRLIDEYCELRERIESLQSKINQGEQFKQEVGNEQYDLLIAQLSSMKEYKDILDKRIDNMDMRIHIPTIWGKDIVNHDDEMLSREKILRIAYTDCLREMYYKSQPSASYDEYVNKYQNGELTDNDRVYNWHYLSEKEYEYIVDKYVHAYGMDQKWLDYVDTVIAYFEEGATKDKWIPEHTDEHGTHPGYRGYEKLLDFSKVIENTLKANKDKTEEELAFAIKVLILQRINDCKAFYRFDREEGDFRASVALGASPTSNPDTVIKYWKDKGVDLEIVERDPDTLWDRDYYGDDYERYDENEIIDG